MIDEYLSNVLNYAWNHQIGYELTDLLSPWTPSGANPQERRIVINTKWHDHQQIPYMAAHEIAHVLHNDSGILYFCDSKTGIEAAANRTAVDILVPIYFSEVDPEDANYHNFLSTFNINENMADYAIKSIDDFYY